MAITLDRTCPANGATAFPVESRPKIIFSKEVDEDSINSGTVVLTNRITSDIVSVSYIISGTEVELIPSLTLDEETGYKIVVVGLDILQPAGHVKSADGEDFNVTQTINFVTANREASPVVNIDVTKSDTKSVYIPTDDPYRPEIVETVTLQLVESNPEIGEIGISPQYLAEKGIRLTFNRPVDYDSAVSYINLMHFPLAGIRAMATDPDDIVCSYEEGGYENFCVDQQNDKLNPNFNIWIQGNDVLLTYLGTVADQEAEYAAANPDPLVSSSNSYCPAFEPVSPSISSEGDYNYNVYGELAEETNSFNFGTNTTMWLTYESHLIKDRYLVEQDGVVLYDSGCVSTDGIPVTEEISIKPYVRFYVTVLGGCDPNEAIPGTAWNFNVTSVDPTAVSSSSSVGASSSSSTGLSSSSGLLPSSSSGLVPSSSSAEFSSSSSIQASSSSSALMSPSSSAEELSSSSSMCDFGVDLPVLNAEIRISISSKLTSQEDSNGVATDLGEDEAIYFLTGMFPLYADVDLIRLEMDNLNYRHTDEQILRLILKNSLDAWKISCRNFDLCNPSDTAISYAEYKTQLDVFDMSFTGSSEGRGKSRHLGDFSIRTASRASNAKRTPKEDFTANIVASTAFSLKVLCGGNMGITWAVKGCLNPTTKPNYRTRTYNWLPSQSAWLAPGIKGYSRYVELPSFAEVYS